MAFVHQQIPKNSVIYAADVHPFLQGVKMSIHQAQISDLVIIEGVSLNKAQALYEFFQKNPHAPLDEAQSVKGVGPKTLEKLLVRFY